MKKVLKWVVIVFVVIIVIGMLAGNSEKDVSVNGSIDQPKESKENIDKQSNNKSASSKDLKLSSNDLIALKTMITDDVKVNFDGGESLLDYGYIPVTAKEMFKTYSENEARGDKKFKGKDVIISGSIESITSSIGDIPVVSLKTGDMFQTVNVNFSRKYRDIAVDLNKNQKVTFACVGGSVVIGMPSVRDCKPIDSVIDSIVNGKIDDMKSVIEDGHLKDDKNLLPIVLMIKAVGIKTDDFKTCKPDNIKCLKSQMEAIMKSKDGGKPLFMQAAKDLEIDVPSEK